MQFILQLKLCLYTTVQLLLEEFKISLKLFLSTQSLSHNKSWSRSRSPTEIKGLRIPVHYGNIKNIRILYGPL